jgi:alcohol dehydrogenase class IV
LVALREALGDATRAVSFSTPLLTLADIEALARHVRSEGPVDVLVAVGGGSLLDAVKASRHFDETLGSARLIAVPTTVGSGSEATPFAAYFVDGQKRSADDPRMRPDGVVLDPDLLASLPVPVARASLLDAFCQACESVWSLRATERSRERALRALALIRENAIAGLGGDSGALGRLLLAAHLAGQAIAESRTTLAHALSYAFTARFGVPHGEAVAIHLPLAARLLEKAHAEGALPLAARDGVDALAVALGAEGSSLADTLARFILSVGGQASLGDSGFVVREQVDDLARAAVSSPRAGNFPLAIDAIGLREAMLRDLDCTGRR